MSEHLKPILASLASKFGYLGKSDFSFKFSEIKGTRVPIYNPDCVWFLENPVEQKTVAIFEADKDPSRKHRVGGVALANVTALKLSKVLHYFAIVPPNKQKIAQSCIDILSIYLREKWVLKATVISSFDSIAIEEQIRFVFTCSKDLKN